ncbi:Afadin, partial [Operophtera brumata]
MRFYFQDSGQKIATKCIRVASDATVSDVIGSYSLWETHGPDDERKLEPDEKPLLVQLNWHAEDREGRFLLKCLTGNEIPSSASGTLRIYGGILRPDVSYITLLLSINDNAAAEDKSDNTEYILEDDECPLALMNMTR